MQNLVDIYIFLWCESPNKLAINQITKKQLRHSEPGAFGEKRCAEVSIHLYRFTSGILTLNSLKGCFTGFSSSAQTMTYLHILKEPPPQTLNWLTVEAQGLADRQQRVTEMRHRMMQKSETDTEERQSETVAVPLFQKS